MKDENAFNAWLSSELKRLKPKIKSLKLSDKFKRGIADFLIFGGGRCAAVECKFFSGPPARTTTSVISKHPFQGEQVNFLRELRDAGSSGWGIIYRKDTDTMYLLDGAFLLKNRKPTLVDLQDVSVISDIPRCRESVRWIVERMLEVRLDDQ